MQETSEARLFGGYSPEVVRDRGNHGGSRGDMRVSSVAVSREKNLPCQVVANALTGERCSRPGVASRAIPTGNGHHTISLCEGCRDKADAGDLVFVSESWSVQERLLWRKQR